MLKIIYLSSIFFFNDTATTEIYTLSLHDALPISGTVIGLSLMPAVKSVTQCRPGVGGVTWMVMGTSPGTISMRAISCTGPDRKSTRLNSSHANISYAVFCLKKKKKYTHFFFVYIT